MDTTLKLPYEAEIFIKSKFLKAQIVELEKIDNIFKVELDNEVFITFDEDATGFLSTAKKDSLKLLYQM